jgi:hypothetical protein
MLPLQVAPAAQSVGSVQSVRHAAPAHAYGAQSTVIGTHAPLPSQVDARLNVEPLPQLAPQAPFGSLPAPAKTQVPTFPEIAHELQPPQAWSQQTPCAQCVLMQSASIAQLCPWGVRLVHELPWQVSPLTQSPSPAHVVRQAPLAPHR